MAQTDNPNANTPRAGQGVLLTISWLWAGVPLAWGVYATVVKSIALFK